MIDRPSPPAETDDDVAAVLALLRRLMSERGVKPEQIDRSLGVYVGYTRRVLSGETHLRMGFVFKLLEVLGKSRRSFFDLLEPPPARGREPLELGGLAALPAEPAQAPVTRDEVERLIAEAVAELRGSSKP